MDPKHVLIEHTTMDRTRQKCLKKIMLKKRKKRICLLYHLIDRQHFHDREEFVLDNHMQRKSNIMKEK